MPHQSYLWACKGAKQVSKNELIDSYQYGILRGFVIAQFLLKMQFSGQTTLLSDVDVQLYVVSFE